MAEGHFVLYSLDCLKEKGTDEERFQFTKLIYGVDKI